MRGFHGERDVTVVRVDFVFVTINAQPRAQAKLEVSIGIFTREMRIYEKPRRKNLKKKKEKKSAQRS